MTLSLWYYNEIMDLSISANMAFWMKFKVKAWYVSHCQARSRSETRVESSRDRLQIVSIFDAPNIGF